MKVHFIANGASIRQLRGCERTYMRFTKQEIMFLTSVSRGNKPLGITLCMPKQGEKEDYIRETLLSLTRKGLVSEEGILTKEGAGILKLWEMYRNSEKHVAVDDTYMALIPEGRLLMAAPVLEEYEVRFVMPEVFMHGILKAGNYLRLGEEKIVRGKWQEFDEAEWMEKTEDIEGSIHIREFTKGKQTSDSIYFWTKEKGYLVNVSRKRIRELSSGIMRRQIYASLGGRKNGRSE